MKYNGHYDNSRAIAEICTPFLKKWLASNGKVRNNVGNWTVHNVPVHESVRGFKFYKQKDIAMANSADYGFMIWDGESKGTLNNMINLRK